MTPVYFHAFWNTRATRTDSVWIYDTCYGSNVANNLLKSLFGASGSAEAKKGVSIGLGSAVVRLIKVLGAVPIASLTLSSQCTPSDCAATFLDCLSCCIALARSVRPLPSVEPRYIWSRCHWVCYPKNETGSPLSQTRPFPSLACRWIEASCASNYRRPRAHHITVTPVPAQNVTRTTTHLNRVCQSFIDRAYAKLS